jgi:biopolymer transport protein ExbB
MPMTKLMAIYVQVLLCIFALGIFGYLFLILRRSRAMPARLVERFTEAVGKRRYQEAFEMARKDSSFVAKVFTAGMGRLQYSLDEARKVSARATDVYSHNFKTLSTYLPTLATVGAMIAAFGGQGADVESSPIAAWNLILAVTLVIPSMLGHAFLMNRIARLSFDVESLADDLLTQMYHASRRSSSTT